MSRPPQVQTAHLQMLQIEGVLTFLQQELMGKKVLLYMFPCCCFATACQHSQNSSLKPRNTAEPINTLHASILSVRVRHHTSLLRIHYIFKTRLAQSVFMYDTHPLLRCLYHGAKATEEGGLLQHLWEREKTFEMRRKRKRWVMNYRADHFRLGPERERERERNTRERDSPSILPCPVWYVGSHWGEQFMAN